MEASPSESLPPMHILYGLSRAGLLPSATLLCFLLTGCGTPAFLTNARSTADAASNAGSDRTAKVDAPPPVRTIRATGTIQAQRAYNIQVPQISGQNTRISITNLVPNGTRVKEGDILVEFDRTQEIDNLREAQAKYDELAHKLEQKRAEIRNNAAKRAATLREAEADLAKAELQLQKAELLSEIDRLKNETKAESARARVASLRKSNQLRDQAEAAEFRVAELQKERQRLVVERTQRNLERLVIRAPIAGMTALESIWRSGSMGPAQIGDQVWPGQTLLRIFDPSLMLVETSVSEPDGAALVPGVKARIRLDAYPEALFDGEFESSSPVASSALDTPIKTFAARFRIQQLDPRLLPDLSASVEIEVSNKPAGALAASVPSSNGRSAQ